MALRLEAIATDGIRSYVQTLEAILGLFVSPVSNAPLEATSRKMAKSSSSKSSSSNRTTLMHHRRWATLLWGSAGGAISLAAKTGRYGWAQNMG